MQITYYLYTFEKIKRNDQSFISLQQSFLIKIDFILEKTT